MTHTQCCNIIMWCQQSFSKWAWLSPATQAPPTVQLTVKCPLGRKRWAESDTSKLGGSYYFYFTFHLFWRIFIHSDTFLTRLDKVFSSQSVWVWNQICTLVPSGLDTPTLWIHTEHTLSRRKSLVPSGSLPLLWPLISVYCKLWPLRVCNVLQVCGCVCICVCMYVLCGCMNRCTQCDVCEVNQSSPCRCDPEFQPFFGSAFCFCCCFSRLVMCQFGRNAGSSLGSAWPLGSHNFRKCLCLTKLVSRLSSRQHFLFLLSIKVMQYCFGTSELVWNLKIGWLS